MITYIVRVYREADARPGRIIGVVEEPEASGKKAFTSVDELWGILTHGNGDGCSGIDEDKEVNKL